jgi:hypothetical protein
LKSKKGEKQIPCGNDKTKGKGPELKSTVDLVAANPALAELGRGTRVLGD